MTQGKKPASRKKNGQHKNRVKKRTPLKARKAARARTRHVALITGKPRRKNKPRYPKQRRGLPEGFESRLTTETKTPSLVESLEKAMGDNFIRVPALQPSIRRRWRLW